MTSSNLFRGSHVHHAPVPRKLSDRATLTWGVIWTFISIATITMLWISGESAWDPPWTAVTVAGTALTATLAGAASRLDATLVFSVSPVTLVLLSVGTDLGTAIAVWGTGNLITMLIRIRIVWDAMEQLAYVLGSAIIALTVIEWLEAEHGWREYYTVLALVLYFAARFMISTIRMGVVTPITVRENIAAIIPLRAAMVTSGICLVALGGRFLQLYIAGRNPDFGAYWGGAIAILSIGIVCLVLAMVWTMRIINTQLRGIRDATIGLPWPDDVSVTDAAKGFVKKALPNYEIEFRKSAGRNINEISSPMADGHLIARRGNNQAPLLEADQLVLDSIAHIGDTMVTVRRDHDRLFKQALTDSITGLPNYRAFIEVLDETVREASSGFAVVYIDLDGFKAVNDRYGHESGNTILHTLGTRFRDHLTTKEFVARVGGDEFVLILSDLTDEQSGHDRVEELFTIASAPVRVGATKIPVVLSYGLSYAKPGHSDTRSLVEEADARMYAGRAVRRGGDAYRLAAPPRGTIARGIRDEALTFAYQPIVDTDTQRIVGLEALVRPGNSIFGGESADQIVARARIEGQLTDLSLYLIKTAVEDMKRFRQIVPELRSIHVNIDVEQIADDVFMEALRTEWERSGLDLTLELGEASLGRRLDKVTARLEQMVETPNLHIALDDFGSEACTLESVIHFPFDVLKVDKSLLLRAGSQKTDLIIDRIIELGRAVDARVIFEGVEDDSTYEYLRNHGARYMQGFRFAKPQYVDDLCDRLQRNGLDATVRE